MSISQCNGVAVAGRLSISAGMGGIISWRLQQIFNGSGIWRWRWQWQLAA